jgi:circadian clock protein KaiC
MQAETQKAFVETGINGLDDILCGGFPSRRMYLLQGDPGAGKTTCGLQILLRGRDLGERVLYVTLSESPEELETVARNHGWSLEGVDVYELSPNEAGELANENTLYVPAEVELGERMIALLAEIERVNPTRIVIDSCSELRLLAQTPLRFRRQILALKQQIVQRGCTVFLIENPLTDQGDVLLQSLVHGVVHLQQLSPEYGAERRRLRVVKLREVQFRGGHHDFAIRRGGLQVYPRLVAHEHFTPFDADELSSGIPALDELLGGGLDRGTAWLLMGPAGVGKSAVATRFAVSAAERGEHVAVFAFDEGLRTLLTRSASLGMPLERHLESGVLTIQQVDPAEMSPGEFSASVREAVEERGARVIVIDSLNGFLHAMPGEQALILQLHELVSYLRQRGVVAMMVVAQHGIVGGSMLAPIDTSYLADGVMLFRYFEAEGRVRKAISVVKKRSGRHEDTIRELETRGGLLFGPPLEGFRGILSGVPELVGRVHAAPDAG